MVTNDAPSNADKNRGMGRIFRGELSEIAIIIAFAAIVLYLSFTTPSFLSTANVMSILVASSLIGILACGQTFVIITGGIDLSCASIVALSGVLAGLALHANVPIPAAVAIGILVGLACGLFNGLSVTYLNMPPFIVTLAAMTMGRGLAFIISNGQTVFGFDDAFDAIGGGLVGYFPIAGLVAAAVLLIGAFVLSKTVFGREVYSVGGNREAAVMAGIPVRRTLVIVYLISGGLAGLGGIILTGRLDSAQPIAAMGMELNAIAAVVIGGASLFGGRGSMLGTILGVLLIGVINNGLTLNNVEPFWVPFIGGAVIYVAALFDAFNQRRRGG